MKRMLPGIGSAAFHGLQMRYVSGSLVQTPPTLPPEDSPYGDISVDDLDNSEATYHHQLDEAAAKLRTFKFFGEQRSAKEQLEAVGQKTAVSRVVAESAMRSELDGLAGRSCYTAVSLEGKLVSVTVGLPLSKKKLSGNSETTTVKRTARVLPSPPSAVASTASIVDLLTKLSSGSNDDGGAILRGNALADGAYGFSSAALEDSHCSAPLSPPSPREEKSQRPATASTATFLSSAPRLSAAEVLSDERTKMYHETAKIEASLRTHEVNRAAPVDMYEDKLVDERFRQSMLQFYKRFPTNFLIQSKTVLLAGVRGADGQQVVFPNEERQALSLGEAIAVARAHGKDLVQMGTFQRKNYPEISICYIEDSVAMAQDFHEFFLYVDGIFATPVASCYEVCFNGATLPHASHVKCVFIAKYIAQRHPVRISLRRFGTALEGFPLFEQILGDIRAQCARFPNGHHTASRVKADYDEIACYLHPSSSAVPLTETVHPSKEELRCAQEARLYEAQREVHVDNWNDVSRRDTVGYGQMVANGKAWCYRDEGQTLSDQRRTKLYLGYIPKGNKKLYEARGDVELKHPYRVMSKTSVDRVNYPRESNLDQARRGATVLSKRANMDISEMHDQNELEGESSTLHHFYYGMSGDAFSVGHLKESMGIKRNHNDRPPAYAAGFATQGIQEPAGLDRGMPSE